MSSIGGGGSGSGAAASFARDSFGRVRTSAPRVIFDHKQIYDNNSVFWDNQEVSGSGTSTTYSQDKATTTISVGATTAGKRVRQTYSRFNYAPGNSFSIFMTGVLGAAASGITSRIGYFDDDNGYYFEQDDGSYYVAIRGNMTGSPVNNRVEQSDWNQDPLDGTGRSGITVDFSKSQIFFFDMEWLGVGIVRMFLVFNGQFVPVHTFEHGNTLDTVYMSTPNLPLRYEIENDGTGVASDVECICVSVAVETGEAFVGVPRSISTNNTALQANSNGTAYVLLAIREKADIYGISIAIRSISLIATTNDDFEWFLLLDPTYSSTLTYGDISNSGYQSAVGVTANVITDFGERLNGGYLTGNSDIEVSSVLVESSIGAAIDGTRRELILGVRPRTNGLDVFGGLNWVEFG